MNNHIIYRATNKINNKSYIGFTSIGLGVRQRKHYSDASKGSPYHFHNALRKYKKDDWNWEILTECGTREEAGELEIELIAKHDTFKKGYNSTTGGDSGRKVSKETKRKISQALMNVPKTANHRKNLSIATRGENNPRYGIPSWNKGMPALNKGKTGVYAWFTNGAEDKYLKISNAPSGWHRGRSNNKIGKRKK